jgi:ubiquinone/menaquinone biosynthesis C-methylase UbiE
MTAAPAPSPFAAPEPWDLVATGYAAEAAWVMAPFSRRAVELAGPSNTADVIDVAAGPGTLSLELAPRVRSVTALDFSEPMLAELRTRAAAAGLTNLRAVQGDGQNLPFEDASFDSGFSMFGLMFFPDRVRGFRELYRVLRPGSRAVVSSWAAIDRSPLMTLMFGALRAADPTRPAPVYDPGSYENPERIAEDMRAGGFADVRVVPHEEKLPVANADEFWERLCRGSAPLVMMRKRVGEGAWAEHGAKARAYLATEIPGPTVLGSTALLAVGLKG